MSLVVVVGLVLSISGAFFTAIASARGSWRDVVDDHRDDCEGFFESLEESEGEIRKKYLKHRKRFSRSIWQWDKAQWIPILLLAVVSVAMTIDVLLLDWSTDEALNFESRHWSWIPLYKWSLGLLVFADVVAFAITCISYRTICDAADELRGKFTLHEKAKADAAAT